MANCLGRLNEFTTSDPLATRKFVAYLWLIGKSPSGHFENAIVFLSKRDRDRLLLYEPLAVWSSFYIW